MVSASMVEGGGRGPLEVGSARCALRARATERLRQLGVETLQNATLTTVNRGGWPAGVAGDHEGMNSIT